MIPEVPPELIQSCLSGESVLFAGAGLSARAGVPTWNRFLADLLAFAAGHGIVDAEYAGSLKAALQEGDRDAAADGLVQAFGARRELLQEFLKQSFPDGVALSRAHKCLGATAFSTIVTTNYDRLLEQTFPDFAAGGLFTPKDAEALLDALSQKRRFLLKLYGIIERPESLIFAPIEYREALSSNVSFAKFMEGFFFSRTFFFVGLSLEGIQDFLSGFVFRGSSPRRHFALVGVSGSAWKAKAEFLARRYNIQVIAFPISETFPEVDGFLEKLSHAAPGLASGAHPTLTNVATPGIRRLVLEDIGAFEKLELDFPKGKNWKILLGDNSVGKSTILKAIAVAIMGSDARSYAARLVRAGKTRGRITLVTEHNPSGYITDILTKDMLSEAEVVSIPSRPMEAEGWLAMGFSPLRVVSWNSSTGPQPIVQKGRPTADDLLPLLSGEADPRMDRLKQWIVNLNAASAAAADGSPASKETISKFFELAGILTDRDDIKFIEVNKDFRVLVGVDGSTAPVPIEVLSQGLTSLLAWVGVLCQRLQETLQIPTQDALPTGSYALVLIDELDAHMHPRWQQVLVHRLKQAFPKVQFIACTHSPLIVGGMDKDEVDRFTMRDGQVAKVDFDSDMTLGRTDQILTGELFDLDTTLDPKTQELMDAYEGYLGKSNPTADEKLKMRELARTLEERIPASPSTPVERRARELMETLQGASLDGVDEAVRVEVQERMARLAKTLRGRRAMIRVVFDPAGLQKPEQQAWWTEWRKRADAATDKVIDAFEKWLEDKPGAPFQFSFNSEIWKDLKDWLLENVFHDKCAYCEREISGYYGDAEHYRPKGAVKRRGQNGAFEEPECDLLDPALGVLARQGHPGYFWLAYDWRNLVPSCVFCNSGQGKNERFENANAYVGMMKLDPAAVEAMAVEARPRMSRKWPGYYYLTPQMLDDQEQPLLLNPLNASGVRNPRKHLRFGVRGTVAALDASVQGSMSIEVFQLKKEKLRQERQRAQESFRDRYYDALRTFNPEDPAQGKAKIVIDEYKVGRYPFSAAALDYLPILREAEQELEDAAGEDE